MKSSRLLNGIELKAMISSTAFDLPEHRAAVKEACLAAGVFPIEMEHLPARDATGITVSLEMVDKADLYIGIYAWRYGWVPDGSSISVTEMEFDRAIEQQKAGKLRELFIFTTHAKHPCIASDVETGDVAQQRLTAFKTKACNGRVRKEFSSVDELRLLVSEALHEFRHREDAKATPTPSDSTIPVNNDPPSNLPGGYIGQPFVGRDAFLEDLRASLLKQTHTTAITQAQRPAATVTEGLGGLGKTHAAVEYAHRHRGDYTALLFVSGDTPQRLQTSLAALCDVPGLHLNDNLPPEEEARASIALHWLATHPGWLLIVDNVDDEAAALALREHFEQLRNGHVLITSRLHNWSQNVDSLDLSVLSPDDATALLLQLTDKHRRKAADDAAQARTLAELMEGLPLALHQAAGYINEQRRGFAQCLVTYQDEAAELLNWFNGLSIPYERPDKLAPRPVLITWKTSFDKLSEETRRWLLVFSHFAAEPIPEFLLEYKPDAEDEVKARHRAAQKAIAQAEKFNLLTRYDDPPRFKLHRLVQEVTRLTASVEERTAALVMGIQLMWEGWPGSPQDVRTWPQWTLLQPHALALCLHAPDEPAPERLTWLLGSQSLLLETKALYAQAEPLIRRALQIDEASIGPEHPRVAIRLNNLAQLLYATNRLAEAEPLMRRALKINEASFGPEHPNVAIDLNNLAQLLQTTNRMAEAELLMRRALSIDESSYGTQHPRVAADLNNLARLLQDTDRLVEAEPLMRRALEIDEIIYGSEHPEVAIVISNLALLLQETNRQAEAEPLMRRALQIDESSYGTEHPTVASDLSNLAQLLHSANRVMEAEPLMRRALEIDKACYGPEHPKVAIRLNNLALLLLATGRSMDAEPLMRRALSVLVHSLGLEHPQSQTAHRNYIGLLKALKLSKAEIEKRVAAAMRGE